jgi:hypothetical protein
LSNQYQKRPVPGTPAFPVVFFSGLKLKRQSLRAFPQKKKKKKKKNPAPHATFSILAPIQSNEQISTMMPQAVAIVVASLSLMLLISAVHASDQNGVYSPCEDATVQRWDGFSFGVAFASYDLFFSGQTRYSPCDSRLSLQSKNAQLAVFRPKVDEISYLTINASNGLDPVRIYQVFANLWWLCSLS